MKRLDGAGVAVSVTGSPRSYPSFIGTAVTAPPESLYATSFSVREVSPASPLLATINVAGTLVTLPTPFVTTTEYCHANAS
jgi:hypothetical protein